MSEGGPSAAAARIALKLLATREHSRLELIHKLVARGFGEADVAPVLDRLAAEGSLNESRMAETYVAERVRKGFGPLRIRRELKEKGLSDAAIAPHLDPMAGDWPDRLAEAHDRRFGPGAPSDAPCDRSELARRARFLEQRGFPSEAIRRFLRWND
jgi:regulatory protein